MLNKPHPPHAADAVTGVALAQTGTRRAAYEVRKKELVDRAEARAAMRRTAVEDMVGCGEWRVGKGEVLLVV